MGSADHPLLSCRGLRVSVPGRLLVDELDIELRRGELIAVLGQNGAGKTLTQMMLADLMTQDAGQVSILGSDIYHSRRRETAQHLALLPVYDVP